MRNIIILALFMCVDIGCRDSGTSPVAETNPTPGTNLISNPTFETHGVPSMSGWTVPDTHAVHFSNDVPPEGSGSSIVLYLRQGVAYSWPFNSVYTTVIAPIGIHAYRLSFLAKRRDDMGGDIFVCRNRPGNNNAMYFRAISIVDTNWTLYSHTDTLQTAATDTIFITINGGSGEYSGITYVNTCKFEILD